MLPLNKLRDWGLLVVGMMTLGACDTLSSLRQGSQERQTESVKTTSEVADTMESGSEEPVSLDSASIRQLQSRLAKLGYEPGPDDGIIGPKTTKAIKRYQTANQMPATGQVTSGFLRHLQRRTKPGEKKTDSSKSAIGSVIFPKYQLGAKFLYSNGRVETVSRVKPGEVQWKRDNGTTYTTSENFLLPWSYWITPGELGTAKISKDAHRLWPGRTGAKVSFSARIAVQRKDDVDSTQKRVEDWSCRNDGRRELKVQAGTFDTVVLICRLNEPPNSHSLKPLKRTWYYSQKLHHFVRFVESDLQGVTHETVDLVAIQPGTVGWPPIIRAGLMRTISHSLETAEAGSRISWTSSGVEVQVKIEPQSRFVSADGRPCRRYVQVWSKGDRHMYFPAVACKSRFGGWQIPGIESPAIVSLIASGDTL